MQFAALPGLDLLATYAYSHARFDGGGLRRQPLPPIARQHPVAGRHLALRRAGRVVRGDAELHVQSKVFFDDSNDRAVFQQPPSVFVADNLQDEQQKAYGLVNLRLSWTPASAPLKFELFANNLLDEDYIIDAGNTGDSLGLPTFIAGPPRMVGAGVTYRF